MADDPLSDVFRVADVQSVVSGAFSAAGEWAIRFVTPPDKIKFFAAVRGDCWLQFEGAQQPIKFESGDVILLTGQCTLILASDVSVPVVDARALFARRSEAIVAIGQTDDSAEPTLRIGGHLNLHSTYGRLLLDVLPPLIHVKGSAPQARVVQWILEQLIQEHDGMPGAGLVASQLGLLLFVQVLRAHLASGAPIQASWLRAAADTRIAPALQLMHSEPARAWRLDQLASAASMSRTSFATHFKDVAGEAPLTYLSRWRMLLAEQALRRGDVAVTVLAQSLGYASESAFSHAFKRIVGQAPKHYVTRHRLMLASEKST